MEQRAGGLGCEHERDDAADVDAGADLAGERGPARRGAERAREGDEEDKDRAVQRVHGPAAARVPAEAARRHCGQALQQERAHTAAARTTAAPRPCPGCGHFCCASQSVPHTKEKKKGMG